MVDLLLPHSTGEAVRRLALQSAVYKRHESLALVLLNAQKASLAEGSRWGNLLHEAAEQGLQELCQELMKAGADAGAAAPSPALRVVGSRGEPGTPLCIVAAALPLQAEALVRLLLDSSGGAAKVNVETESTHATPIMFAASAARHDGERAAKVVQLLLDRGARLDVSGGVTRRTPLMWAAMVEGDRGLQVVRVLLDAAEKDPSVDLAELLKAQDDVGDTAVMLAVGSRSPNVEKEIRARAEALQVQLPAAPVS